MVTARGTSFDVEGYRDLRESGVIPPPPPPTGDLVATLATKMLGDLEHLTGYVVERVVAEVDAYRNEAVVVRGDLWWSCYRNAELVLTLLIEDRRVADEELGVRRALGARRAQQGLAIEDVLQAFHVGCLVLWEEVMRLAETKGRAATAHVLARAGQIWSHMHEISGAVAHAHRMEVTRAQSLAHTGASAFLSALAQWPLNTAATDHARDLGFDPKGGFVAAMFRGPVVRGLCSPSFVLEQPDRMVVMCAATSGAAIAEDEMCERLRAGGAQAVGVGLARTGIDGAKATLRDAERAHTAALRGNRDAVQFREDWFLATVVDAADDLNALVSEVQRELADEETADTVATFLQADGRMSETAKRLHVHPNTVTYRLDRFKRKTGVDLRTMRGAMLGRLVVSLMPTDPID